MVFSKKYCPIWVYDCVVSQSVNDFILYGVDLTQPCRKFAGGLTELFEEVSLEELVRASELVVQFLVEEKLTKTQLIYCLISHITASILPAKKLVENLVVFLAPGYLKVSANIVAMRPSKTSKHTTMKIGRKLRSLAVQDGVWQHKQKYLVCRILRKIPVFK